MPDADRRPTIDHLASLARLALTPEERALFEPQLARILDHARRVVDLDTSAVVPDARTASRRVPERPDEPVEALPRDAALDPAPDADPETGLMRVPRVPGR